MRKIKIGQIGTGHDHAGAIMECARKLTDFFEVIGIAEPNEKLLEMNKNNPEYKGLKWIPADDLLKNEDIDAIFVETGELDLVPTAIRCLKSRKHVQMDKPAGEDIGLFTKMMRIAKASNLIVQLGYMYRFNPSIIRTKEMIEQNVLGKIYEIDGIMDTGHTKERRKWLQKFKGGTMFYLGCHMIDLIVGMQGIPNEIIPYNMSSHFDGINSIDHGFAVFRYDNGISTVRSTSTEVNGYGRRQLVVCGDKGSVEIKPLETGDFSHWYNMMLSTSDLVNADIYHDIKAEIPPKCVEGRYDSMLKNFACMVTENKPNPYNYEYEVKLQQIILKTCGFDIDYHKDVVL